MCSNKEKGLHAICHSLFCSLFWQILIVSKDISSFMCVYEQIRPYNRRVNTFHRLYLACVWYVLDTCWKREMLVISFNENAELCLRHNNLLDAVNILAFRKRLLAKFCKLGQKLLAFFNFRLHFASMRAQFWSLQYLNACEIQNCTCA